MGINSSATSVSCQLNVTINTDDLPKGITLTGDDSRTVTVAPGRRQPVLPDVADG